jgi:uncharacterized protein YodC (DUF2158 family)
MKTNYTNEQLQEAIDKACKDTLALSPYFLPISWNEEQASRLTLARAFLDNLPEPQPPVVDGKTPAQVAFESVKESDLAKLRESFDLLRHQQSQSEEEIAATKTILQQVDLPDEPLSVQAQRMVDQYNWQLGIATGYEKQIQQANEILRDLGRLRSLSEAGPVPDGCVRVYFKQYQSARYFNMLRDSQDTHFADIRLPYTETPDPYAELKKAHAEGKVIQYTDESHYGGKWQDCYDPFWVKADKHRVNARYRIKPEPLVTNPISLPEWTPQVGDVVRLKSGGPLMTTRGIDKDDPSDSWCHWFDGNRSCLELFPTACLEPATKEDAR